MNLYITKGPDIRVPKKGPKISRPTGSACQIKYPNISPIEKSPITPPLPSLPPPPLELHFPTGDPQVSPRQRRNYNNATIRCAIVAHDQNV